MVILAMKHGGFNMSQTIIKAVSHIFFMLIVSSSLLGCGGVIDSTAKTQPFKVADQVGRTFDLQTVIYNDGRAMYIAHPGDMSFQVDDNGNLIGNIFCNPFSVTVTWGDSGTLTTSNFVHGSAKCTSQPGVSLFNFSSSMNYNLNTINQLQIMDTNRSFTANFLRK